ncbi:mercury resistance system transport protein MerF [Halomonas koreensis]|uniref:Mercury resistance system transport protein MerF n=1 Tax=Halomonas koreensis TaxID=245385 RepID=A0ABU1G0N2_9GAMM|nr:mercury resistance system transport protein MerF [Halomonas koreensis]MDR5866063.1 mercury resistance system transport protein MerF [Halomonas koreensis]
MTRKRPDKLLRLGVIGTLVVALCCFTPVLVVLLGAVGLTALTGYLDLVLLPALAGFIALTLYALWRRRQAARRPPPE